MEVGSQKLGHEVASSDDRISCGPIERELTAYMSSSGDMKISLRLMTL